MFVEFALLVPIFTLLAMGIVEYGLGWKWANDANAAVRDAARTGSSARAYQTADKFILQSIGTSLTAEQLEHVEKVIVFRVLGSDGQVPSVCMNLKNTSGDSTDPGTRLGIESRCNVYGVGQIEYVLANPEDDGPWVNSAGTGCNSSDLDSRWCPATRSHSLDKGEFDTLGVYLEMKKPSSTNFGFGEQSVSRTAVFRLEPAFGGA